VFLYSSLGLLFCGGCETDFSRNLTGKFSGKTPLAAAEEMQNKFSPEQRRNGINQLSDRDFGRKPPYTIRYQQIAQFDTDWLVRATAIRALNRSRDASATPIFIKALGDDIPLIRIEAAKALANIPDANAIVPLVKHVSDNNEDRDVRIWCAQALRHYPKNLDVARTLAMQLTVREFGIAWQAHQSLVNLTGKDLKYDETAWLKYFTGPENPFG
jgi:HEAT repeat protein